jgi:CRP-like cAMP-binding protein
MMSANRALLGIELFKDLSDGERDAVAAQCRWRNYFVDQLVIGHKDPSTDVYFIATGRVRVTVFSPKGKEVSFRDLGAGASFGELAAFDGRPRSANVVALGDTLLGSMPAETLRAVLTEHPKVADRMMSYLADLVRKLSDRVVEFSVLAVKNRIHAELLRLAREHGIDDNAALISPSPTHAVIATRISTHRERVTRELAQLARDGVIKRRRGALEVLDIDRLSRLVEAGSEE